MTISAISNCSCCAIESYSVLSVSKPKCNFFATISKFRAFASSGLVWKGEPTSAIDCPAPHTSPVWFSGSFDFMQVLGDVFFAGLAIGGKPSLKK